MSSDFDIYLEVTVPIRIEWEDSFTAGRTPFGEIDAPPEVVAWLERQMGRRVWDDINDQVRGFLAAEREEQAAQAAECREMYARERSMAAADFANYGYLESKV